MKVGVIQFPGSNCDQDTVRAFEDVLNVPAQLLWHKSLDLDHCDALVLPGGFSYGDYLRCGAIARFSPIMRAVERFAAEGGPILGICNGFQVLCECGLLPGALLRNRDQRFICKTVKLEVQDAGPCFRPGALGKNDLSIPIAHADGNYYASEDTLQQLKQNNQILLRYAENNPNGSLDDIAGIRNQTGNIWGMMPHPERAVEAIHPSKDGCTILKAFQSHCMRLHEQNVSTGV